MNVAWHKSHRIPPRATLEARVVWHTRHAKACGCRPMPRLKDRLAPGLRVMFVGINPGVRSALTGHHFAGFSNRFWKLLSQSRLVPEPVTYVDDDRLPEWGFGITNVVARATPGINELKPEEYAAGRLRLRAKVRRYHPDIVAFVGITVYRAMFPERSGPVTMGPQLERLGEAAVFVLPNTSGRNAHFSFAQMLAAFDSLRRHVDSSSRRLSRRRVRLGGRG